MMVYRGNSVECILYKWNLYICIIVIIMLDLL